MKPKYPLKEDLDQVFDYINNSLFRKLKNGKKLLVINKKNKKDGYCAVKFNKRSVYYHIIVYILHHGSIKSNRRIDHIDGNKINNSINNLRLVTIRENQQNQKSHRLGRLPGTTYNKIRCKWISRAKVNGVKKFLGAFDTELQAHEAYVKFIESLLL
jgi:hypothetical protein